MILKKAIHRAFTLLEVMVAIALLALVGGVVSIKMHDAVEKKKFHSDIERFKEKIIVAQRIAVASQADWSGCLNKGKTGWDFSIHSEERGSKQIKPLHLANVEV